ICDYHVRQCPFVSSSFGSALLSCQEILPLAIVELWELLDLMLNKILHEIMFGRRDVVNTRQPAFLSPLKTCPRAVLVSINAICPFKPALSHAAIKAEDFMVPNRIHKARIDTNFTHERSG